MPGFLEINERTREAFYNKKPVIALESTIISHGLPYPQNLEVAKNLERIALENGVVPATICLMNGKIKIGLEESELEILAKNQDVKKVSSRDIGRILVKKEIGATTVSATMRCAYLAGINVFATGGIGGVHRNAEISFDISTDLIELSRTPVIVVSAGAKAILDLSKTLEMLETLSVPVYGYGTDHFPAFYSSKTNLKINRIDSAKQIAEIFKENQKLGLSNGILVANSIPEKYEIPYTEMEEYIEKALQEAKKKEIKGQKVTPFLLSKIVDLTKGKSLSANIKLVENNVRLACEIVKNL
ncbi:MAG TPA: pseudouridine-5'-phosphate glycosidase [Candidatus Cloacimonetes bacterium]|nr:pseudouridine-5'-phosphate glycosidase [Candidatus Cloacimonadota bacterium]